jgi:predicted ATPase/DNA-binding SARP family transcriptional activator
MQAVTSVCELRLFGHAGLWVDGAPLKLAKRATTLSLLGYLVLHRNAPVARTSLAYTLFPDETEEAALGELRRYLYLSGKLAPAGTEPWIRADSETLQWNPDASCRVDVIAFENAVGHASTQADAVALYSGDLLQEVYDDWVAGERERLRRLCVDALVELIARRRTLREFAPAIAFAQQLLVLDPWREDVVRSLMALRYESADAAGALAEFARFAQQLRELQVTPMPETLAVRDAIARGDAVPGAVTRRTSEGAPAELRAPPLLPFIGREREYAALEMHWTRAARGNGTLVLVDGEAGVGKTRLVAELARIVESQGGRVFVGATSFPESVPYQPLVEALRSALPVLSARKLPAAAAAALGAVLPELQPNAAVAALSERSGAEREPVRVLAALSDAALALSRPRPALLVLEDLHWAGTATLDALATLARKLADVPLLVVGTYRGEETGPSHSLRMLARELGREQRVATVQLACFDAADVAALIAKLDARALDAAHVHEYTGGNALFINEVIADARERDATDNAAPPGIAALVATRIERLSDEAKDVVEVAAVCGSGCSVEVVRDVVQLTPVALAAAFNELLDRRILRDAGTRSGVDFAFTHELIAAAVYARLDERVRARRHARIAHVMQHLYAARPDSIAREVAVHFDRAGAADDAAHWYGVAARASAAVYATDDAIGLASRALDLGSHLEARITLLRLREELRGRRGDRAKQREDIDALAAAVGDGDIGARFDVARRRMLLARSLGETEAERGYLDDMTALAADALDERLAAESLRQRAAHAVMTSRQSEAREPALAALALFEALGDVPAQVECLGLLVDAEANGGELPAARAHLATMRERAQTQADRALQIRALTTAATAALVQQQYRETQDLTQEALAIAEALGDRDAEAFAQARIAATAAWLSDFNLARVMFARALELFEELDNKRGLATTLTNAVLLAMRLGRFDEARALIARSDALLEVVQEPRMWVANRVNASFIALQQGDAATALRLAQEGLATARSIGFPIFEAAALANVGNAERVLGDLDGAIAHMQEGLAIRRGVQHAAEFADDLADLTLAYVQADRADEARTTAEELAALSDDPALGALWSHYIAWAISAGFRAAGDATRASAYAARARELLSAFASSIGDEDACTTFLAMRISRDILEKP